MRGRETENANSVITRGRVDGTGLGLRKTHVTDPTQTGTRRKSDTDTDGLASHAVWTYYIYRDVINLLIN